MTVVSLRVNGATHEVDVDTSTPLLYVLRNDLDLRGPRFGCGLAQCGACTVIIDGVAMRSCIVPCRRGHRRDHHAGRPRERRRAASAAASLDRRAGAAVRLLPERPDHDGQGAARSQPEAHGRRDPRRHGRRTVPLHDVLPHSGGDQTRGARCAERRGGCRMSTTLELPRAVRDALRSINPSVSRRGFLASSGALVLSVGVGTLPGGRVLAQAVGAGPYPDPDFLELDTWIVIHPDNTATFFVGKTDGGQGTGTAFRQMMCDELDLAYEKTSLVMGRTDITPDQGGSGGSDAIERDGWPIRRVAAEARRVLLELGSERLEYAGRGSHGEQRHDLGQSRRDEVGHLRRARRRQTLRRRAHGAQCGRHHGHGGRQTRARAARRRQTDPALRHSGEGRRLPHLGRGREAARHAPRAQRAAAGRRRATSQHR